MGNYENHYSDYSKSGQETASSKNTFLAVVFICLAGALFYFVKYNIADDFGRKIDDFLSSNKYQTKKTEKKAVKKQELYKFRSSKKEAELKNKKEVLNKTVSESLSDTSKKEVASAPVTANVASLGTNMADSSKSSDVALKKEISTDKEKLNSNKENLKPPLFIPGFMITLVSWEKVLYRSLFPVPIGGEINLTKVETDDGACWRYNITQKNKTDKNGNPFSIDFVLVKWFQDNSGFEIRLNVKEQPLYWTVRATDDEFVYERNKTKDVYKIKRDDSRLVTYKNGEEFAEVNCKDSERMNGFKVGSDKPFVGMPYEDGIDHKEQLSPALATVMFDKIDLGEVIVLYMETLKLEDKRKASAGIASESANPSTDVSNEDAVANKVTMDAPATPGEFGVPASLTKAQAEELKKPDLDDQNKESEAQISQKIQNCPECSYFTFQKDNKDCSGLIKEGFRWEDLCFVPSFKGIDGKKIFPFSPSKIVNFVSGEAFENTKITSEEIDSLANTVVRKYTISGSQRTVTVFQSLTKPGFKLFVGENASAPQKLLWNMNVDEVGIVFSKSDGSLLTYMVELSEDKYKIYRNNGLFGEINCVDEQNLVAFQYENQDKKINLMFENNYKPARKLYSLTPMLFSSEEPDIKSILFLEALRVELSDFK